MRVAAVRLYRRLPVYYHLLVLRWKGEAVRTSWGRYALTEKGRQHAELIVMELSR